MSTIAYFLLGVVILLIGYQNIMARSKTKTIKTCPKCSASKIVKIDEEVVHLEEKTMQGIVTNSEYIATVRRHYRCQNCGNAWQVEAKEVR